MKDLRVIRGGDYEKPTRLRLKIVFRNYNLSHKTGSEAGYGLRIVINQFTNKCGR